MLAISGLVFTALFAGLSINAAPALEERAGVTTLTAVQVASYKPYTFYAATAYCNPVNTLAWNCGGKLDIYVRFDPI